MGTMNLHQKIRNLNRASKNGYETTFAMHGLKGPHYRWELIRYPLDVKNTEPTETLLAFEGRFNWDDAIEAAKKYLAEHPDDGFYDD